jgi:hypothetical protein
MRLWKKILLGIGIVLIVLVALFVTFVGPWPTYSSTFEGTRYFNKAIAAIDQSVKASKITDTPGRLKVGWGVARMNPDVGVPLAGYGAREGKPSTGVHDDLYVKALAFSDGEDTAVVVGADMLLVPPNVAEPVRAEVAKATPLTPNNLFFTASHTHDGPGGLAPGFVADKSFGKYDAKVPGLITQAFTKAIIDAYNALEPAKMAHGGINAEQFIRNRTRQAPVDPELSYLVLEKDNGKRCYLVSFSAHPTILDDDNMQFSAEYPGYLQRAVEKTTGATCVYLGGAVGSMGPRPPQAPDAFAKCQAMGEALANRVLENTANLRWETNADVVSIGIPFDLPQMQVRLFSPRWRLSPLLGLLIGVAGKGWMTAVRVGDLLFVNTPGDFSGEISVKWKEWAANKGYDLWASGFSGEYVGYISPDQYYNEVTDAKGGPAYETGLMSWTGPHQEAFFTALMNHMVEVMGKAPATQQESRGAAAEPKPVS